MELQKIEKWRIEELALVLSELADILIKGNNNEWANVFLHFREEAQFIIESTKFDLDLISKLTKNIKNCFTDVSSLINLVLWHKDAEKKLLINEEFPLIKARLLKIVSDIEKRTVEYVS